MVRASAGPVPAQIEGFAAQDNLRLACGLVLAILRDSFWERHIAARVKDLGRLPNSLLRGPHFRTPEEMRKLRQETDK